MKKNQCRLSGIIKHNDGIGFKITFDTSEQANKYKDMMKWILKDDGFKVLISKGYYDVL